MSSLPATVADFYRLVVGVDTQAATHNSPDHPGGGEVS